MKIMKGKSDAEGISIEIGGFIMSRTWLITGVSSGFGNEMTKQLLERGDTVIGTVRNTNKVSECE